MRASPGVALLGLWLAGAMVGSAAGTGESRWGPCFEADFPFVGSVVDARGVEAENLTPRGLILNLGHGYRACFDPDLLRIALVWRGDPVDGFLTPVGMGPGSYENGGEKAPGGQDDLPRPVGEMFGWTGLVPGWWSGEVARPETDPRERGPLVEEIGRGPLDPSWGRWDGIRVRRGERAVLLYDAGGTEVEDRFEAVGDGVLERRLEVAPHGEVLHHDLGRWEGWSVSVAGGPGTVERDGTGGFLLKLDPSGEREVTLLRYEAGPGGGAPWPGENPRYEGWGGSGIPTGVTEGDRQQGYAIESIAIPWSNPWRRNLRLSGIDFLPDGRAVLSTFDGDIWIVAGLGANEPVWRRYASGLQEPMGVQIVDREIFVFDRTAIWRLRDEDGDGEADHYVNFCHAFSQTAETREFASDFRKIPGGGFYVAKAGQSDTSAGRESGTVLRVARDGSSVEVVARGLRQPFLGYDGETDLLTSSDQQGHWVPATPVHRIRPGAFYGYLQKYRSAAPQEVEAPMVWIPHFVNQSAGSQVTNWDERFGPLRGALLHLGYNRPEVFRVYPDGRQGAVASLFTGFETGLLKAAVNPEDGQLYLAGFKIWGTVGEALSALQRVRCVGGERMETPMEVRASLRGVLLRFDGPVEPGIATNLSFYQVDRWNYRRSGNYGSGHYRLDGEPGQETVTPSSVYLSEDGSAVFLGIPGMARCDSMRVTYRVPRAAELGAVASVYLTVHELEVMDLEKAGFNPGIEVDLSPRESIAEAGGREPSVAWGEEVFVSIGCVACHSLDGSMQEKVGPTWLGLYGSARTFSDGTVMKRADDVYLRESILDPGRKVTEGYDKEGVGMPSYLGILNEGQIESLILLIQSLGKS